MFFKKEKFYKNGINPLKLVPTKFYKNLILSFTNFETVLYRYFRNVCL